MRERVCKNCGGRDYKVVGQNMVKCRFCGTLYVDESASKEEEFLIVGANEKARSFKFDDAVEEFNKILTLYPMSFEAFYGKALAKNKIILYSNKKGTSKKPRFFGNEIPSISEDEDFKHAVELAPPEVAKTYTDQAKRIDKIKNSYQEMDKSNKDDLIAYALDYDESDEKSAISKTLQTFKDKNISVYFLQDLEHREKEEETFFALQNAKVMIIFANVNKGFSDGDFKNLYDRYLYFVSQKKKTKSGLLVALDKEKVTLDSLPKELTTQKNILDLNSLSFQQDLITRIKNEIETTINETAKIDTVKIEKVAPDKKTYIDFESIEPSELGHYHVENMELSETNKIKWIFLTIKHGDFASAEDLINKELEKDPNNAELLFAELMILRKIKTQEEFFSNIANFIEKEKIDKILSFSSKEFAEFFVDSWENLIISLDSDEYYNAFLLYLAKYDTPNREIFIEKAEAKAVDTLNEELIDKVLKCFKKTEVERFVDFYFMLAQSSDNQEYYEKILAIDEGHEQSNLAILLQHFKTEEEKLTYRNKQEIEEVFKYLSENTRVQFVSAVVNFVLPLAFFDIEKAQAQLDFYLSYISDNAKLVGVLKKIYLSFQEMEFFVQAEKYVTIAISKLQNKAELYWHLILIKSHCKTDNELIMSSVKIAQFPEWETMIALSDEKETEKYAEIASKMNLYNGEKLSFRPDMMDKKRITEKLNEFLNRNNKLLLEMESQEKTAVSRGVDYFRLQLKPFEKYITDIQNITEFKDYQDIISKIDSRLDALDLKLDASINVVNLLDKEGGLKPVYQTNDNKKETHEKEVKNIKKDAFLKKFLYFFFELFPLLFTTLLLTVLIFLPKEVYMYFNLEFLVVALIFSVAVGMINLVVYINTRHKNSKSWNFANLALFCIAALNLILLCFGFYFTPKTITVDNAHELQVIMHNAGHANIELTSDIDMKNVNWQSVNFSGTLNGNNHKIENLKFDTSVKTGFVKNNAGKIENIEFFLEDALYNDVAFFGAVAATNFGQIQNCKIYGSLNFDLNIDSVVGGMVGTLEGGQIYNCENNLTITISAKSQNIVFGGMVGEVKSGKDKSKIVHNTNSVFVQSTLNDAGMVYVGGLAGCVRHIENDKIDISTNSNFINIKISGAATKLVSGGIVGQGYSRSQNNYVNGVIDVSALIGNGYIGGIYGQYENSDLTSEVAFSYSTINITSPSNFKVGGLVGGLGGKFKSCFSTADISLIGEQKFTQAQAENSFKLLDKFYNPSLNFDINIWNITGDEYPTLI